jgi:hypothetical protein
LLFYNENNPRFNYKPKRFTCRNGRFACDDYSIYGF